MIKFLKQILFIKKAVHYLSDSATKGNQWAQYQLGKMFLYGKEIGQDITRGFALLESASRQGNVYANLIIDNYYRYRNHSHSSMNINAALRSLRLFGHLARTIKKRINEEHRREDSEGIIEKKLRRQTAIKKEAHGLRLGG